MEAPFQNREIEEMFADVKKDLAGIITQTTKTNGSVADINKWRERANGAFMASGFFMTLVVVPILAWSLYILVNINETIHKSVDEALAAYNITSTK